jgi:hypothetical protein
MTTALEAPVPYSRITSVAFVSDKSMFGKWASTSKISILAAGKTYEVELRGDGKARHVHNIVLWKILQ